MPTGNEPQATQTTLGSVACARTDGGNGQPSTPRSPLECNSVAFGSFGSVASASGGTSASASSTAVTAALEARRISPPRRA